MKWIWTSVKVVLAAAVAAFVWFWVQKTLRARAVCTVAAKIPGGEALLDADWDAFEVTYKERIDAVEKEMATATHAAVVDDFRQRFRLPPPPVAGGT